MKQPEFLEGVGMALVLAICASLAMAVLASLFPFSLTLRGVISLLSLVYAGYLLKRCNQRVGRITTASLFSLLLLALWLGGVSLTVFLGAHVLAIWLIRSLYFYHSVLQSLMDLGLQAIALLVAQWAALQSGSTFLVVWAFFLVQALFCIPLSLSLFSRASANGDAAGNEKDSAADNEKFRQSARDAEAALKALYSQ